MLKKYIFFGSAHKSAEKWTHSGPRGSVRSAFEPVPFIMEAQKDTPKSGSKLFTTSGPVTGTVPLPVSNMDNKSDTVPSPALYPILQWAGVNTSHFKEIEKWRQLSIMKS